MYNVVCNDINFLIFVNSTFSKNKGESMDKKSTLQILDSVNEELQGKMKNLVWCDSEQKNISIAVPESYEFSEADAAGRSIPKERLSVLSELACGRRNAFFVPPDQTDEELKIYLSVCDMLPTNFECFPSMQMVPNPDLDSDESEIEVGRLIPFSGGSVEFPLGEGLLNFLYADFETAYNSNKVTFEEERETDPIPFESEAEQKVFDYLRLAETVKHFRPVIHSSLYTMLFPPFLKKCTKKEFSAYLAYLKALQTRLMELITFVFDEEYHPSVLKKMSANQRYALYCRANHCTARYEYQYIFDYPELGQNPLGNYFNPAQFIDPKNEEYKNDEMQNFCVEHRILQEDLETISVLPCEPLTRFQCSSIENMLIFELWEMLTKSVRFRKCKRCGRYFIMKGNYDTNYCDRVAEGETRNCQELAAQENYKKKMADNAAIPLYQKYYKRYAARVRVRQIKEYDFKKWKYQAMTKRDECTDGKITLTEFETWLEASFPNRKKKN